MSSPKQLSQQAGFTIVELVISIVLIAIIGSSFLVFFKSSFFNYLNLQSDATSMSQINTQAMRVSTVMRGITSITSASNNDIVAYSYFYPSDAYVSLVHYYLQTSGKVTKLYADVTPLDANPPTGALITDKKKTYTIIDDYYQASGTNLFAYLDSAGNSLAVPISDLQTVKGIQVSLAAKASNGSNQALNVQVSLRNKKTNL